VADNYTKSKKVYLVSLSDRRWLNGFMAAGFHSGLISLSELKLEYMKAHRNL
jgi:hypothetical protein